MIICKANVFRRSTCPGFSLIELLAAVAVIAVLFSLVMMAVGTLRAKAEATECASNMRHIGVGLNLYATDHGDDRYPRTIDNSDGDGTSWSVKLIPYVGMTEDSMGAPPLPRTAGIFQCPSYDPGDSRYVSYAYNANMTSSSFPWNYRRSIVPEPSRTILVVECEGINNDQFARTVNGDVARRHLNDSSNILFVDGHVESVEGDVPYNSTDDRDHPLWRWW